MPDIINHVFCLKLDDIIKRLTVDGYMCHIQAHVYVIKFQKRGLPHTHILIIMYHNFRFLTPDNVDRAVSAELPDPVTRSEFFQQVVAHNLRGPCGVYRPNPPRMKDVEFRKDYPYKF